MSDPSASSRLFSSANLALGAAALVATAAVGIAIFRPGATADPPPNAPPTASSQAPSLEESIARLQETLRRNPDDQESWFLLGLSYRESQRFAEAAQAFRRAVELAPDDADHAAYLGEALVLGADGAPPPEAERLFRRALELQPDNPQARYYLATLTDFRGGHREAVDALIDLLEDAPAGAPWEPQVREAVVTIAQRNDIDIEGRLPPPAAPAGAAIPGPTREQMAAASAIPPGQQQAMVQDMVDRLAARLEQNPRDAEGWIRLMRSRMVLEDPAGAREALRSGLAAFADDAATQQRLRRAAGELDVP